MIALDTNVLVRLAVGDDPVQSRKVAALLQQAAEVEERCFLADPVLCELEWVLESCYDAGRRDIAATIQELLAQELFVFENRDSVAAAVAAYLGGNADFSDHLIGERSRAQGARTCYTFDRTLARGPGFSLVA